MDDTKTVLHSAETLLSDAYHDLFHLDLLEQFESSHTVLRCAVQHDNALALSPATIIVKQRALDLPRKANDFDQIVLFCNEWASLDFLTSRSTDVPLCPRIYASDRASGLVVLEDLGSVQSVQDILFGEDSQQAVEGLLGMGTMLGRLQGITIGHEAEFLAKQSALSASTTICDANLDLRGQLGNLHDCMSALGIDPNPGFDSGIIELENAIHGHGVFRTFIHNDAGPHNFVVGKNGVQLIDFEFAGYGHGLVDVVCARLAFPPAFRGRVLPMEIVRKIEATYRSELEKQMGKRVDDNLFNQSIAQACAHWAFSKLVGFWDGYFQERLSEGETRDTGKGRDPKRGAFARMQVFSYLRLANNTLEEFDQLPEVRHGLSRIVNCVMTLWPETPLLPAYPAFGSEPWHYPSPKTMAQAIDL